MQVFEPKSKIGKEELQAIQDSVLKKGLVLGHSKGFSTFGGVPM